MPDPDPSNPQPPKGSAHHGSAPSPGPSTPQSSRGSSPRTPARSFQAPKGTRDFYPQDLLRRRYITDAWRRVSLRHGFEEIDGPTFEHAELYTVKSGEGILSELFSFKREGGEDLYALRPEFTPTLARMYAARAKQLPQPTKWFCVPSFFRAEKPQRGRLREFFQWNVDVIGGEDEVAADAEVIGAALGVLEECGVAPSDATARVGSRRVVCEILASSGVPRDRFVEALALLDKRAKLDAGAFAAQAGALGLRVAEFDATLARANEVPEALQDVLDTLATMGLRDRSRADLAIARGLAYYTGRVFEVIAEGERAVAGGGRYDNLIELFGGPPTPACGFGMGDVVLGNLLDDRGLIPEGPALLEALSRPMPMRPDAFVIAGGGDDVKDAFVPLVASLRRGVETARYRDSQSASDPAQRIKPWDARRYDPAEGGVPPMHARRSYKQTKNVGKLLADASACHAQYAVIIESAERATLKNLDTRQEHKDVPISDVGATIARGG